MIDAVAPGPGDNRVEIGPGLAGITVGLVERGGQSGAIEIDELIAAVGEALEGCPI